MAYDRYDRDERQRWSDDRSERGWRGDDRSRPHHHDDHRDHRHEHRAHDRHEDDRGFFERAGDEISSWFGGGSDRSSDTDRHRDHDHSRERGNWRSESEHGHSRDYDRGYGRDYDRDRHAFEGGPSGRYQNEDRGLYNRGGSSDRDYNRGWKQSLWGSSEDDRMPKRSRERPRERSYGDSRSYRPMAGDYGRGSDHESRQFFAASGFGRGERGFGDNDREEHRGRGQHRERSDYDRSQTPYGRDDYRRTSFAGSRKDDRDFDPHYRNWRDRHMSEIDQDYDDYRREHQSKFENDFGGWREKRQQKRSLLGQVREHMDVVGSDDEHIGAVDKVAGDRLILAKSDPASGGVHHSISCSDIDRIEGDRVILDCKADETKRRWRDEDRGRALFERQDQGEAGPGVLERSFSGTYR